MVISHYVSLADWIMGGWTGGLELGWVKGSRGWGSRGGGSSGGPLSHLVLYEYKLPPTCMAGHREGTYF